MTTTLLLLQIVRVVQEVLGGGDRDQLLILVEQVEPELSDSLLTQLKRCQSRAEELGVGVGGLEPLGVVTVSNFDGVILVHLVLIVRKV